MVETHEIANAFIPNVVSRDVEADQVGQAADLGGALHPNGIPCVHTMAPSARTHILMYAHAHTHTHEKCARAHAHEKEGACKHTHMHADKRQEDREE